jgi:MYXO-CTERM domain-containing protein
VPDESVSGVTFTTGDGPFEGEPEPPRALLEHYQFSPGSFQSSCSPPEVGTCVALAGSLPVDVTFMWNGNVDGYSPYLYQSSFFTNLSGIEQGTPFDCVSLRARAPNRRYSAPVQLCGDDGQLLTLSGSDRISCTPEGLVQEALPPAEGQPGEDEDANTPTANADDDAQRAHESASCSVAAPGASTTLADFAFVLGAAALLLQRRRR